MFKETGRKEKAVKQGDVGVVFVFILPFGLEIEADAVVVAVSPNVTSAPVFSIMVCPRSIRSNRVRLSRLRKLLGKFSSKKERLSPS